MVEVAVALPILTLLLFAGLDITRYIQLIHKTDQSAASIADALSGILPGGISVELDTILPVANEILSVGSFSPDILIRAENILFSPLGTKTTLWSGSVGAVPTACAVSEAVPDYNSALAEPMAPHQSLVKVQICIFAGGGFYLSNILPLKNVTLSSVSFRPAVIANGNSGM